MENFNGSLLDLNAAIEISPSAELHTNRGVVYQYMKDMARAMMDYQTAIRLDAEYGLALYNAATVYIVKGQYRQVRARDDE